MPAPRKGPKRPPATRKSQAVKRSVAKSAGKSHASTKKPLPPQASPIAGIARLAGDVNRNFNKGAGAAVNAVRNAAATVIPGARNAQTTTTISRAMQGAPQARQALRNAKGR